MILQDTVVVVSILGITIFAFYYLLKENISLKKKIPFLILRLLIGIFLIIAFLEPSFTISRYITPSRKLGILVDASQSMSLFNSDSLLKELRKRINIAEKSQTSKSRKIKWFLFGDSLRNLTNMENINFNDNKSFFPFYDMSTQLKDIDEFIIVSDGNLTNQKIDFSQVQNKMLWYIKLPDIKPMPFISLEAPETLISYLDQTAEFNIICKGFATNETKLDIILEKDEKNIFTDSILVLNGYFYLPYSIKIKNSKKGYNLYKITVVNRSNNIKSSNFFLHKVIPNLFKYSICFDKPSIDIRFLKLALGRDKRFVEVDSNLLADVLFLFSPEIKINNSKIGRTLLTFIGCAPDKALNIKIGKEQKIFLPDPTIKNPFFALYNKNFPPVSEVIKSTSISKVKSWLSISLPNDTIPLVFTADYKRNKIIICAFSEIWQWDFLPFSYNFGETDAFTLSGSLVNAVASTLYSMQNDTFLVFPLGNILENKYIKYLYTLPDDNYSSQKVNIQCKFYKKDNLDVLYDTLLEVENTGSLFGTFSLPSFNKGSYIIKSIFSNSTKKYNSECHFEVLENNEELSIMGQNETILKEIGKLIDIKDTVNMNLLLKQEKEILPIVVPYSFTIKKSWLLLLTILSLFAIEWFLRKLWNIER